MSDEHDGGLQAHTGAPLVYDPNTGTHWRLCYASFAGTHPNGRKRMELVYEECSRLERDREVCARQYDQPDRPDVYCMLPLRPCPEHPVSTTSRPRRSSTAASTANSRVTRLASSERW